MDKRYRPYIHSKLFLVDDRFLSVGSANMNNRSMGLDTELNVAWEAESDESSVIRSIRRIRVDLLAEHLGARDTQTVRKLSAAKGLVDYLDGLAESGSCRLRRHPSLDVNPAEYEFLTSMLPDGFPFDMEAPQPEDILYEGTSGQSDGFFARGIASFKNMFKSAAGASLNKQSPPTSAKLVGKPRWNPGRASRPSGDPQAAEPPQHARECASNLWPRAAPCQNRHTADPHWTKEFPKIYSSAAQAAVRALDSN